MKYVVSLVLLLLLCPAQASNPAARLPALEISKLGELVLEDDEFDYRHWRSGQSVNNVHVLQYFPGTMSASKTFEPFTDFLQEQYEAGSFHITTIINLDAAVWGTGGKKEQTPLPSLDHGT